MTSPESVADARFFRRIAASRQDREERSLTSFGPYGDGSIPPPWWDAGGTPARLGSLTPDRALQHGTVFACVSLLADIAMQLPVDAYRRKPDGSREEIDPPAFVTNPHPELYPFDWTHRVTESLVGEGNTYLRIEGVDQLGYPTMLRPLHPDDVTPGRDRAGRRAFRVAHAGGGHEVLAADGVNRELIHIPAFTVPGRIAGLNRIGYARLSILTGLAAEGYGAQWFADAADPSSVLETDNELGDDQVKDVQRNWIQSHGGRRLPAVLTGGFKWRPISIKPEESQFLATQKWSTTQIARVFRVPPHLVGDVEGSTSWGTGIEEQTLGFLAFAVQPYLTRLEQALSRETPGKQFLKFNAEALLRTRTLDRYMAYVHARNAGWLNVNEIRQKEDLAAVDGGDQYLQPLNMGPLGSDPTKGGPSSGPAA